MGLDKFLGMRAWLVNTGLILAFLLTILSPSAGADPFCLKALTPASSADALVEKKQWQEALWRLLNEGRTDEAMALESKLETELLTAKPLKKRLIKMGGVYRVTFSNGIEAIFKEAQNSHSPRAEPLAYLVDKTWGYQFRVPLTVWRKDKELHGSLQLFVPQAQKRKVARPLSIWIFDMLIGNIDRVDGHNLLRSSQGDVVAIDNEAAMFLTRDEKIDAEILLKSEISPYVFWSKPKHSHLAKFLQNRHYSENEFRQIVASLDEEKLTAALKGRVGREGLAALLETLHFFKAF